MEIPYANFYPESLTMFFEFRQVSWLAFVLVTFPFKKLEQFEQWYVFKKPKHKIL